MSFDLSLDWDELLADVEREEAGTPEQVYLQTIAKALVCIAKTKEYTLALYLEEIKEAEEVEIQESEDE